RSGVHRAISKLGQHPHRAPPLFSRQSRHMMGPMCRWIATSAFSVLLISVASADEPAPPSGAPTRAELEEMKAENRELRDELDLLKDDLQQTDQRVDKLAPLAAKVTGYLDFGFF